MSEAPVGVTTESKTNALAEKLGHANVRKLAAVGLALSALFGLGDKVNSGASIGVEVPDPFTGKQKQVGVGISLGGGDVPLGVPEPREGNEPTYNNIFVYQIEVNGTKFYVYGANLDQKPELRNIMKVVAVRPGAESKLFKTPPQKP